MKQAETGIERRVTNFQHQTLSKRGNAPPFCRLAPLARAACFLVASPLSATEPVSLYVAVDGNDSWSGALPKPNAGKTDGPFASLERARDEVRKRQATAKAGVTAFVRGGEYLIPDTLKFAAADSGSQQAPIVYRAYESERPILVGGRKISDWRPWKGDIVQSDFTKQGFPGVAFLMLEFDGKRQHLARY